MAPSSSDNFKEMFHPEHPHRRMHILVSILAIVLILGSIFLYWQNKSTSIEKDAVDQEYLDQMKANKLLDISQSFTTEPSPQQKAKLESMTNSFNN
jgi:hypothetical protein